MIKFGYSPSVNTLIKMAPVLKAGETLPAVPAPHHEILQVLNVWEISPPENYLQELVCVYKKEKKKRKKM